MVRLGRELLLLSTSLLTATLANVVPANDDDPGFVIFNGDAVIDSRGIGGIEDGRNVAARDLDSEMSQTTTSKKPTEHKQSFWRYVPLNSLTIGDILSDGKEGGDEEASALAAKVGAAANKAPVAYTATAKATPVAKDGTAAETERPGSQKAKKKPSQAWWSFFSGKDKNRKKNRPYNVVTTSTTSKKVTTKMPGEITMTTLLVSHGRPQAKSTTQQPISAAEVVQMSRTAEDGQISDFEDGTEERDGGESETKPVLNRFVGTPSITSLSSSYRPKPAKLSVLLSKVRRPSQKLGPSSISSVPSTSPSAESSTNESNGPVASALVQMRETSPAGSEATTKFNYDDQKTMGMSGTEEKRPSGNLPTWYLTAFPTKDEEAWAKKEKPVKYNVGVHSVGGVGNDVGGFDQLEDPYQAKISFPTFLKEITNGPNATTPLPQTTSTTVVTTTTTMAPITTTSKSTTVIPKRYHHYHHYKYPYHHHHTTTRKPTTSQSTTTTEVVTTASTTTTTSTTTLTTTQPASTTTSTSSSSGLSPIGPGSSSTSGGILGGSFVPSTTTFGGAVDGSFPTGFGADIDDLISTNVRLLSTFQSQVNLQKQILTQLRSLKRNLPQLQ